MIVKLSARNDAMVDVEVLRGDRVSRFAVRDVRQVAEQIGRACFVEVFDAGGNPMLITQPWDTTINEIRRVLDSSHEEG